MPRTYEEEVERHTNASRIIEAARYAKLPSQLHVQFCMDWMGLERVTGQRAELCILCG